MSTPEHPAATPPLRPSHLPGLAAIVFAVVLGLGVAAWKAWGDPDTAWLSREGQATWIRYPSPAATKASAIVRLDTRFRSRFAADGGLDPAVLQVRFFRTGSVRLNGVAVSMEGCSRVWKEACRADVGALLRPGDNDIEVVVANDSALPCVWLSLSGRGVKLLSDANWDSSIAGSAWRKAVPASEPPAGPRLDPFDSAPPPLRSLSRRWPAIAAFALLSAATLAGALAAARRRERPPAPSASPWPLRIATAAVALLWSALFWNDWRLLPLEWGFDAPAHLDYVTYILDRRALPLPDEGWSMFHPPLYYLISAASLWMAGLPTSALAAAAWLRAIGLAIGIANVSAVAALLRRAIPDDPALQVVGALTAASLPAMIYLHLFVTNEILVAMLSSVVILLAYRILEERSWKPSRLAVLGAVLGLALLTKFSAFLLVPPVLGLLGLRAITGPRPGRLRQLGGVAVTALVAVAVCGWHYARVWARFGTPFVTGWENRPGLGWWVDPGYRTVEHFLRFGRALTRPLFAGYDGFWDGLYSTLWGDGLVSGLAAATPWPPWWSPSLQAAGYVLALVPACCAFLGAALTVRRWVRSPTAEESLLLAVPFLVLLALGLMSMRVPCVAQDKATYGLVALGPFCVFVARGLGAIGSRRPWIRAVVLVAFGTWTLNSFATYWVDGASTKARVTKAMESDLAGDRTAAVRILRSVVGETPSDWRSRLALARILTEAGGAAPEVERLLRPGDPAPDLAPRYLAIALWEGSRRNFGGAAAAARHATELEPDDADAWAVLASALEAQGQRRPAIAAWEEALRIQPQDRAAHAALASLLLDEGELDPAALHQDYVSRLPR